MKNSFYIASRKRLCEALPKESYVAVLSSGYTICRSADDNYDFQVNNNFYYLTGIAQPQVHLVLVSDGSSVQEALFIDEYNELYAKWIGHRLTKEEAADLSGIATDHIYYRNEYDAMLKEWLKGAKSFYLDLEKARNVNFNSFGLQTAKDYEGTGVEIRDIYPYLDALRSAKQPEEIELLKKAIAVTNQGIQSLMKHAKAGMYEYQLEAYFDHVIKDSGNRIVSFKTIAASGENATVMHYSANNSVLKDGDLILFDLGCREEGYCADISRTFPINGKYTPLQRQIYDIVLAANKKIIEVAKAGMSLLQLQEICTETLAQGGLDAGLISTKEEIKKYYIHSVSHSIGLDTHDTFNNRQAPLPSGAVISDEPGLYFPQYRIGVRIEDDLLLTENGAVNLSADIIKEADEIEKFMEENRVHE